MTLSDDDKQFIKDAIDYRIKRNSGKSIADTESGKKLSKLEYDEKEKRNRDILLKELQERDKRGENTIAQKVEMLNLSMKKAIPDDLKEAFIDTRNNIKKGTDQALSGVSHLTNRLMMSNPLTAMLWQNRDLAKAAWDVGSGSVKAVAGGIYGLGRGAAGLVNNAINMFKKGKEKKEEIPEDEAPEYQESKPQNTETEEINKEEKSTAQKITEIHDAIFKDYKKATEERNKQQKEQKTILSNGLAGLGKSMKAVNALVETIQLKQKLIIGGVLLGVTALLGLATWFKGGKLLDLIKKAIGFGEKTPKTTPQDAYKLADVEKKKTSKTRQATIDDSILKESKTGDIEEVKKDYLGLSTSDNAKSKKILSKLPISGYKMKANAGQPYRAPFDLKVLNWRQNEKNKNSFDMEVERLNGGRNAVIMNIESPMIVPGQTAKRGQIIGIVPALGEIFIKDISKQEFEEYKKLVDEKVNRTEKEKTDESNYMKQFLNTDQSNKINDTAATFGVEAFRKNNSSWGFLENGEVTKNDVINNRQTNAEAKLVNSHELDEKQWESATIKESPKLNTLQKIKSQIKTTKNPNSHVEWDRTKELERELKNKPDTQVESVEQELKSTPNIETETPKVDVKEIPKNEFSDANIPKSDYTSRTKNGDKVEEQNRKLNDINKKEKTVIEVPTQPPPKEEKPNPVFSFFTNNLIGDRPANLQTPQEQIASKRADYRINDW